MKSIAPGGSEPSSAATNASSPATATCVCRNDSRLARRGTWSATATAATSAAATAAKRPAVNRRVTRKRSTSARIHTLNRLVPLSHKNPKIPRSWFTPPRTE